MELKLIFVLVSLNVLCYHTAESAKASCEFSAMEGVNGNQKLLFYLTFYVGEYNCQYNKRNKIYVKTIFIYLKNIFFTETINGKVEFSQGNATENLTVKVSDLVGLSVGKHGFHIHSKGNCKDPGPHFNPHEVGKYCGYLNWGYYNQCNVIYYLRLYETLALFIALYSYNILEKTWIHPCPRT